VITITIKNLQKKIPVQVRKIRKTVSEVISAEGLAKKGEVNVSFITDGRIKRLNSRFHGRETATDVLAFDLSRSQEELVADIYISADRALKNSRIFSSYPERELLLYVIHGLLHLAGYGDHKAGDIKAMRSKEDFYLSKILGRRSNPSSDN
jgi:probable rRNA maturation factor